MVTQANTSTQCYSAVMTSYVVHAREVWRLQVQDNLKLVENVIIRGSSSAVYNYS